MQTIADALLTSLAAESRYVFADWRALILIRRATYDLPRSERRWDVLPTTVTDIGPTLRQMIRVGQIAPLFGAAGIYRVTVPFAQSHQIDETEVLMELNPYSALRHLSAMEFHNLTDQLPKHIWAFSPRLKSDQFLPLGTVGADWQDIAMPPARTPDRVLRSPVSWRRLEQGQWIGFREYSSHGASISVTTVERTLIDGLRYPDDSGGIDNVLRAWHTVSPVLDLDAVIALTDAFGIAVLRNRVGFVLDQLGFRDLRVDEWADESVRGSSNKLVATEPFVADHDPRWNMSINSPIQSLAS